MPQNTQPSSLSRIAVPELVRAAQDIAGFKLMRVEFASAANVSGVRTKTLTFSRRRDSRTVFALNTEYGYLRPAGAWTSADKTAITACRRALRGAKIPAGEIGGIQIQREMGQTAERTGDTEFRVHERELMRKLAVARRVIRGIPVWSSYATVGLTAKGDIGSLELHWPELSDVVVHEAGILQQLVKRGFKASEVKGGRAESIEAGIIHSAAIGFFMDIAAVVRIVYAVNERNVGRKPVLYLDRHGDHVELPRTVRLTEPKDSDRSKPSSDGYASPQSPR